MTSYELEGMWFVDAISLECVEIENDMLRQNITVGLIRLKSKVYDGSENNLPNKAFFFIKIFIFFCFSFLLRWTSETISVTQFFCTLSFHRDYFVLEK